MRILLAEDEAGLRQAVARGLREEGYVVDEVDCGDDALHMLRLYDYAVAVLDWRMPGMSGAEVIRSARKLKLGIPIIMLTAMDTLADKVAGLDAGADDYMVKPFQFDELLARLRALQRRSRGVEEPVLTRGGLRLDPAAHEVTVHGAPLALTAREFAILELLMRRSPALVERMAIARHVWPDESDAIGSNLIDVHVAHLRRKLAGSGVQLITVRGAGYRLVDS